MSLFRPLLVASTLSLLSGCLLDPTYCWESDKTKCCADAKLTDVETDIDCGGGLCGACGDGKVCLAATDCLSGVCTDGVCAAPTCTDTVKNGTESDIDCGGATCPKCGVGKACGAPSDCASISCKSNACAAPTCEDEVKNGTETDKDCGGSCDGCGIGGECDGDSGNCSASTYCHLDTSACAQRLSCGDILVCASACTNQGCIGDCTDAGTTEGNDKFNAVTGCMIQSCLTPCTTGTEADCEACIGTNCSEETAACQAD